MTESKIKEEEEKLKGKSSRKIKRWRNPYYTKNAHRLKKKKIKKKIGQNT